MGFSMPGEDISRANREKRAAAGPVEQITESQAVTDVELRYLEVWTGIKVKAKNVDCFMSAIVPIDILIVNLSSSIL